MSLRDLNRHTRRRLRRHAALLAAWCIGLGLATSWLLLHGLAVRSPALRYTVAAIVMYSLGLVVGVRIWLVNFSRSVAADAAYGRADPADAAAFDAEQRDAKADARRRGDDLSEAVDAADAVDVAGGVADWLGFDEGAALLLVPALAIALLGGVWYLSALSPMLLVDGLAAMLAEVAVQFVFGALIARRVLRPKAHDAAWLTIVDKTWIAGIAFVVLSAAVGWLLGQVNPGGASIADLFR